MTKAVRNTLLVCTGALTIVGLESGFSFDNLPLNASHVHSIRSSNDVMTKQSKKVLNGKENIYSQPDPTSYLVTPKKATQGRTVKIINRKPVKNNIYDEIQTNTGLKGWINAKGVNTQIKKIKKNYTSQADLRNLHDSQANLIKISLYTSLYNNGMSNGKLLIKASNNFLNQAVKDNHKIRKPSLRAYSQREIDNAKKQLIIVQEQRKSTLNTSDMKRTAQIGNQLNIANRNLQFSHNANQNQKISQLNNANKALNKATQINSKTRNRTAKILNIKLINNMVRYYDTINGSLHGSNKLTSERDTALLSNARQAVHNSKVALHNIMATKNNKPSLNNVKHMINQSNNDIRIAQVATNQIQSKNQLNQANKAINSIVNV